MLLAFRSLVGGILGNSYVGQNTMGYNCQNNKILMKLETLLGKIFSLFGRGVTCWQRLAIIAKLQSPITLLKRLLIEVTPKTVLQKVNER